MRFDSFRKVWASRRLSCLHFNVPSRCEPRLVHQAMLSVALDLLVKEESSAPAQDAGAGSGTSAAAPAKSGGKSASPSNAPGAGRANGHDSDVGSLLERPACPTLPPHEIGPGSLPFQIGALYVLYALQGTQMTRDQQPVRVNTRGVVALLFLRRRLKAAGVLAVDALAVLEKLVRGGLGRLQPTANSGPESLAYVDSIMPIKTTEEVNSRQKTLEDINEAQVEAAKKAAAAAVKPRGSDQGATTVGSGGRSPGGPIGAATSATSAAAGVAEGAPEAVEIPARTQRSAQAETANGWGPQDRVTAAIVTASAGVKYLDLAYKRYSTALRNARVACKRAREMASGDADEGGGEKAEGSTAGPSAAAGSNGIGDVHRRSLENRHERFKLDLAAMLKGAESGQDLRETPHGGAYGLANLARNPPVTAAPAPLPPPVPSCPLPPLPPPVVRAPRGTGSHRASSSKASAVAAPAASDTNNSTGIREHSQAATQSSRSSSGKRNVRDHILANFKALEESNENEGEREDTNVRTVVGALDCARPGLAVGIVPAPDTSAPFMGLPDGIGGASSTGDQNIEMSEHCDSVCGGGDNSGNSINELPEDAMDVAEKPSACSSSSPRERSPQISRGLASAKGRVSRRGAECGRETGGRDYSAGNAEDAAARLLQPRTALQTLRTQKEEGGEDRQREGTSGANDVEDPHEESSDSEDDIREFEAALQGAIELNGSKSQSAGTAAVSSTNDGIDCSDVQVQNLDNLLPPLPSPPRRTKRNRPEERSSSPSVGEGPSPPAGKKPCDGSRTRSAVSAAEPSGRHLRKQQGRRVGASAGGGSDREGASGGERAGGIGKVSSMAAVEKAAAARKRAAERAKKAKAATATRASESRGRKEEEHGPTGAWQREARAGRSPGGEEQRHGRHNDDDDTDADDELSEFERYHDDILATVAGVTTPSRSGDRTAAAAADVRGERARASTARGSANRRAPGGKRPRGVGKASSMAAVEEAAAARKRAADLAKKEKAAKVTRGTGSEEKHDRKGAWEGDASKGLHKVEEKEGQGQDNDEDEDEDDDDELAEFERYHDDILATVAGVTTSSRTGNSDSAAAAGARGGATSDEQMGLKQATSPARDTPDITVATIKKQKRQRPRDDGRDASGEGRPKKKKPAAPRTKKSSGRAGASTAASSKRAEKKSSFFATRGDRKPASSLTVQRENTRPGDAAASPVRSGGSSPHGEIIARVHDDKPVAGPAHAIDRAAGGVDEGGEEKGGDGQYMPRLPAQVSECVTNAPLYSSCC